MPLFNTPEYTLPRWRVVCRFCLKAIKGLLISTANRLSCFAKSSKPIALRCLSVICTPLFFVRGFAAAYYWSSSENNNNNAWNQNFNNGNQNNNNKNNTNYVRAVRGFKQNSECVRCKMRTYFFTKKIILCSSIYFLSIIHKGMKK